MSSNVRREQGHSAYEKPFLNTAGKVYVGFICILTGCILYGLVLLFFNRASNAVRVRGFLPLCFAIIAIHVYLAAVFIVYPLNGWYKCSTEFWYMSVVFPLGIAIFQLTNIRLLAYSKKQRELVVAKCWAERKKSFKLSTKAGFLAWFHQADWVSRSYVYIGAGLIVQVTLTFILFFGSKRFNPSFGIFGEPVGPIQCRRGAEWIPSVIWQFVSTWVVGPWVLFKSRDIRDTHYWALQTRLVVIASLFGTPMWLAFLYSRSHEVNLVNAWWPPAMWFAPGLIMMEITSIVLPLWSIHHVRISEMMPLRKAKPLDFSTIFTSMRTHPLANLLNMDDDRLNDLSNCMDALDFQIRRHITPLLHFAANCDFTAENIEFLREIKDFKRKWRRDNAPAVDILEYQAWRTAMYLDAARIFFELVDNQLASFPINIDSRVHNQLADMFRAVGYTAPTASFIVRSSTSASSGAAPWTSSEHLNSPRTVIPTARDAIRIAMSATISAAIKTRMYNIRIVKSSRDNTELIDLCTAPTADPSTTFASASSTSVGKVSFLSPHAPQVPVNFDVSVFDYTAKSIKYLVFTNTWRRFVAVRAPPDVVSVHELGATRYFAVRGLSPSGISEFLAGAEEDGAFAGTINTARWGTVAFEEAIVGV